MKTKVSLVCKQCGRVFEVNHRRKNTARFCSIDCCNMWKKRSGADGTHILSKKVEVVCKQCGKRINVSPSRKDRTNFCSRKCQGTWRTDNMCGENGPRWEGGNVVKVCEQCGKKYTVTRCRDTISRFCSHKCRTEWQTGENSPAWKGGVSFEPYCPKFNEAFKESIREKFDRVCFLCPTTEEENGRKLDVHHVNYDKSCLCDDAKCEFVPLCVSCHIKTNYNRGYWENLILKKLGVTA